MTKRMSSATGAASRRDNAERRSLGTSPAGALRLPWDGCKERQVFGARQGLLLAGTRYTPYVRFMFAQLERQVYGTEFATA
jgi:hypothetical protein